MTHFGYTKQVKHPFNETVEKLKKALLLEGFGIITEIDVQATMKRKLNKDVEEYMIFGACNPLLALEALAIEKEIGLLLPCNVIVYKKDDDVFISAMRPTLAMSLIKNKQLEKLASDAEEKLKIAIDNT